MTDVTPFPFATIEDLHARWPDMPPGSDDYAAVQLEDASQFILDTCPSAGDATAATRRRVVCSVVKRSMQAEASEWSGMTSFSEATGPFNTSGSPANPHGDFYLTKQEKLALGSGGKQIAYGVQVASLGPVENHRPWCDVTFGRACSCGASLTGGDPLWEA